MTELDHRPVDREVYENELATWLPERIFDVHVHVSTKEHVVDIAPEKVRANWALEVGIEQDWQTLKDSYATMFAKNEVSALCFGGVFRGMDIDGNNEYIRHGAQSESERFRALMVTCPEWDAKKVDDGLSNGYIGIKPYPEFALNGAENAGIFDFTPHTHLEVLNKHKGILMMHLPRKERLASPDNIRELLEINDKYPDIKLIVAHIGRCFCLPTAQKGLPHFKDRPGIYFDTSANLNGEVFEYAISLLGPERVLFGTDLPITVMHGTREHVGEAYYNFTDGNYSWNRNRKPAEVEAKYTYFLYEELRALKAAFDRLSLTSGQIEKVMYANAADLVGMK